MSELLTYLADRKELIDRALDESLPPADERPELLHQAMRHAVLSGGKRLRAILCLAAAEAVGGEVEDALWSALALEVFHTYTLVHDDLPCMDDDDLRRGVPTVHVKYGEANAVLTGDALLTLAFEFLGHAGDTHLVNELANAGGSRGVIAGQVEDLAAENEPPDAETLEFIHRGKTASLFSAALRMGGLCGGATPAQLFELGQFGGDIGLAFQIIDDILDTTSDTETLGKPAGSDEAQNKATYVTLHGVDAAREEAQRLRDDAIAAVRSEGVQGDRLAEIASFILDRSY